MKVRVRFAPAPTGDLHLGNARVALINYAYALRRGGEFILRFDDTDPRRSSENYAKRIAEDLKWLGIEPDKEPLYQSSRMKIYQEAATRLLKTGKAYRCFCSEEMLREMKKNLLQKGKPPRYTGRCRKLTKDEIEKFLREKKPFVIRVKVESDVSFEDPLRGAFSFSHQDLEDFIILRSDGIPTYNFACAVDDGEVKITHVIRGEDHISNTAKQVYIFKLLYGENHPEYIHVPLLVRGDGAPLSKREGGYTIRELRREGYLPDAVVTYLMNTGWNKLEGRVLNIKEISKIWDLSELSLAQPRHTPEALRHFNQLAVKKWMREGWLPEYALKYLDEQDVRIRTDGERWKEFLGLVADNLVLLSDLTKYLGIFDRKYLSRELWNDLSPQHAGVLEMCLQLINGDPSEEVSKIADALGLKKGVVMKTLRVALTGLNYGPPLARILLFLHNEWRERVKECIEYIREKERSSESI